MLTKYERELVDYWKNWKPGMKPFKPKHPEEEKIKHTKKLKEKNLLEKLWKKYNLN